MTTTTTPDPEDENNPPKSDEERIRDLNRAAARLLARPELIEGMRNSVARWGADQVTQAGMKSLGRPMTYGDLEKATPEQLVEVTADALDGSVDTNHHYKDKADESDRHARASKWAAIVSAGIALLALFGALPQGIAAIPDAWAVITGGWPPAPPSSP